MANFEHSLHPAASDVKNIASANTTYFHANQYNHMPEVGQFPDPSTDHRYKVFQKFVDGGPGGDPSKANGFKRGAKDIRLFLGDTSDSNYPVWRDGKSKVDHVFTEVTGVFDLGRGTLGLYLGNPRDEKDVDGRERERKPTLEYDFGELMGRGREGVNANGEDSEGEAEEEIVVYE
jgi:hypothetical protein